MLPAICSVMLIVFVRHWGLEHKPAAHVRFARRRDYA
jgi:hypothetical protein